MKSLLYVSFENSKNKSSGVNKKITGQINAFRSAGYDVSLVAVHESEIALYHEKDTTVLARKIMPRIDLCRWVVDHADEYDIAYIRFQFFCPFVFQMLKALKKSKAIVLMEIPTYPYVHELKMQGMKGIPKKLIDEFFGRKCVKYIDRFVSPLYGEKILGKECIAIWNGIDIDTILPRSAIIDNKIDLLAVAMMGSWHGYDRVIEGIHQYYMKGGTRNIVFHLVGEGVATPQYCKMIEKYELEDHVIQHGKMFGDELNKMYDICDIGVGSLAAHRKGVMKTNTLKVLEYLAKGMPVLCDDGEVGVSPKFAYRHTVPADDSAIEMSSVVEFYDRIFSIPVEQTIQSIRSECELNCSVQRGLEEVFKYLQEVEN